MTTTMEQKLEGLDRPYPPAEQLTREQQLEIWSRYCELSKIINGTRWSQRHSIAHLKDQVREIGATYVNRFQW